MDPRTSLQLHEEAAEPARANPRHTGRGDASTENNHNRYRSMALGQALPAPREKPGDDAALYPHGPGYRGLEDGMTAR
ncbi:hypothetical protein PABY_00850 [Pyrodictium abyssi]|uniref:Uncharacterized protein n=1 Tax=Pyrodictium abyssi TaxID=54256 RepID=A0ABM8ISH5_9CREN|nr:hypothetical protein PABY_00850 [Pyrodictium abyssi]